ncbi:hypothetical protein DSECCO2_570340 [anaerobic digester metagenome]
MTVMEGDEGPDIHIGNAVAVSHAEGVLAPQEMSHPEQPAARLGLVAGVHQGDAPRLGCGAQQFHPAGGEIHHDVRGMEGVVEEVFLDLPAPVAQADDEIVHAVAGVDHHDVPQDGPASDLDHGLGANAGFLGQARAAPPGQDDGFHDVATSQALR